MIKNLARGYESRGAIQKIIERYQAYKLTKYFVCVHVYPIVFPSWECTRKSCKSDCLMNHCFIISDAAL